MRKKLATQKQHISLLSINSTTLCILGRSFGVVLWELLTCEIPYRDVDNSAIIYGVGSSSLHLPIPSTCPDGFRLIVQMCWNSKPRNRPSFKYILMHLDIAAVEIRSTPPETYFKTQVKERLFVARQEHHKQDAAIIV